MSEFPCSNVHITTNIVNRNKNLPVSNDLLPSVDAPCHSSTLGTAANGGSVSIAG